MAQPDNVYDRDADQRPVHHQVPSGNLSDPRGEYAPQKTPLGDSSDPRGELKDAEESGDLFKPNKDKESTSSKTSLFNPEDTLTGFQKGKARLGSLAKNKWFVGSAVGGGGLFVAIAILLVLLVGSLKIPNLSAHILEYQFARVMRQSALTSQNITEDKVALDALESTDKVAFAGLRDRYQNLRGNTWGKLDKYRPDMVVKNMQGEDRLKLHYSKPNILGARRLKGITIENKTYLPKDPGKIKYVPVLKDVVDFKNQLSLAKDVRPAIVGSLQADNIGPVVRGRVAKQIRQELGINLIAWTVAKYRGQTPENARVVLEEESYKATADQNIDDAKNPRIKDAAEEEKKVEKENVANPKKLKQIIKNNGVDEEALQAMANKLKDSPGQTALGLIVPYMNIAIAGCTIYDGSLSSAGPTINSQTASQQKAFYFLNTAADQQKYGDTTGEAVDVFNDKLGDITLSNPEIRASGGRVDTSSSLSAEGSASGQLSIVDATIGTGVGGIVDKVGGPSCDFLLHPATMVAAVAAGLVATVVTGGGAGAVEGTVTAAADTAASSLAKRLVERVVLKVGSKEAAKETLGRTNAKVREIIGDTFTKKNAAQTGALVGATVLAKIITMNKAHSMNTGLEQSTDYVNMADSGGNIHDSTLVQREYYGRPMNQRETANDHTDNVAFVQNKNRSLPISERYFAFSNPDSLLAQVATMTASTVHRSPFASLANIPTKLFNPLKSSYSLFGSILTPKSLADSTITNANTNYGNVQWGFSREELDLLHHNPTYRQLENDKVLTDSGQAEAIEDKYKECFDGSKNIGDMLAEGLIKRDSDGNVLDDPDVTDDEQKCSPNDLGLENNTYGMHMVFRWRVSNMYSNGLDQLIDEQEIGSDTPSTNTQPTDTAGDSIDMANLFKDSSNVACAANTKDLGIQDGYTQGHKVKIRICAISNTPSSDDESSGRYGVTGADGRCILNSRVSNIAYKMVEKAKQDGVTFSANSCFRTMARQEALWVQYGMDPNRVARPGTSNHQMGLAIDFSDGSGSAIQHRDKFWDWLVKNASSFGYKNYPAEAWHWSPTGN